VFRRLFDLLVGLVLPCRCHLCARETGSAAIVCAECDLQLAGLIGAPQPVPDVAVPSWSLGIYDTLLGDAIKIVKYRPSLRLLTSLGEHVKTRLTATSGTRPWLGDVLVPAPMHATRERDRGFNQAERLAGVMGSAVRRPVVAALCRVRVARPQAECDETERTRNLEGVIAARPSVLDTRQLQGKHLVLVDDVTTTGATLAVCAAALQAFRPASVTALVLAHQPRKFRGRVT